jgi:TP901 family phage tail tape measure protein
MEALEKEVTRLQGKLPKTNRELDQTAKASKRASGGVKAFGTAVKTALGPIGLALAAIGGLSAAFRSIAGQDFAVAKVESLGVNSAVLVKELTQVSKELKGNASVAELTAAAYDVASAGFTDAADAAKVLKAASLGAVGGFSDINTVGDAATSVLNAYGKSADEAGKLIDGFIQTQNDGKIVVDQYAQNIGKVASAAAGLKIPIEEVNTIIAQSTASGVQAEVAFTGLKGALARLASGEASKALASFGIEINSASLEADGLLGTLEKFKNLDTGAILKALGTEAGPALLPVINNLEKAQELLENQTDAAGAAQAAQEKAANTINGAWNRVRVAFENLFSDQAALAQAIIPILDAVANAVNGITFALEQMRKIAAEVNGLVQDISNTASNAISAFGGLGDAIGYAATQLSRLLLRADGFEAMDKSGWGKGTRNFGANYKEQEAALFAAADAASSSLKPLPKVETKVPTFSPGTSGGGSGGGGGADQAARRAEQMKEQLATAEKLVIAAEREQAVIQATNEIDKAMIESENKILEIAEKYGELAAKSMSDAETEKLLKAQGLEVQNERLKLEEQITEMQESATASIDDEILRLQAVIAGKEEEYKWTKMIKDLEEKGVEGAEAKVNQLRALTAEAEAVENLKSQYESLASGIAGEMTGAFRSIIDGSKSAEEAMADMFQGIANKFLDMAMQILTDAITQQLISLFGNLLGGVSGGFNATPSIGTGTNYFGGGFTPMDFFADGGRPPTNMPSIVGERGPELFVPDSAGTVLSNEQSKDALATYSPANAETASAAPMASTINYNGPTLKFNGNDYIPRSEANSLVNAGAKQGEQRAMNRLRQSRSSRSKIGL